MGKNTSIPGLRLSCGRACTIFFATARTPMRTLKNAHCFVRLSNALRNPYVRSRLVGKIAFALADCGVVCLMWSQHAAASKWVKHECLTAVIPNKFPTNFNLLKRKKIRKLF
jgi:hypothetical protein